MMEIWKRRLKYAERLLGAVPNVSGIGFGLKERNERLTRQWAWRIYVSKKLPNQFLEHTMRIPDRVFGFDTDVIVRQRTQSTRARVVQPGEKIANSQGVPGTLGCLVKNAKENNWYLLTNAHVLLGRNASKSEAIWQIKEETDGSYQCHLIGKTMRTKIGTITLDGEQYFVDGALGCFESGVQLEYRFPKVLWNIDGARFPEVGESVKKIGSSSGLTHGVVVDISYPDYAYVEGKSLKAPNQILIAPIEENVPFSGAGDSGAVLLDDSNQVVGLLWGNNAKGEGIACHIMPVIKALEIRIEKPNFNSMQKIKQCIGDWYQKVFVTDNEYAGQGS